MKNDINNSCSNIDNKPLTQVPDDNDSSTLSDDRSGLIVKLKYEFLETLGTKENSNNEKTEDGEDGDEILATIMGLPIGIKDGSDESGENEIAEEEVASKEPAAPKVGRTKKVGRTPRRKRVALATSGSDYNAAIRGLGKRRSQRKKPATALSSSSESDAVDETPRKRARRAVKEMCSKCGNTFDAEGYKYHIDKGICDNRKTKAKKTRKRYLSVGGRMFPELEDKSRPFCCLPSYDERPFKFSTQYGVVQIVQDSRMPDDFGDTIIDNVSLKPEQTRRNLWKLRINARKGARKLREYQKWQERRQWIDTLYQNFIYPDTKMASSTTATSHVSAPKCLIVSNLEKKEEMQHQCPLPGIIAGEQISVFKPPYSRDHLQGNTTAVFMNNVAEADQYPTLVEEMIEFPPMEYIFENILHPTDSYPERIVECILVPDERSRVTFGQTYPYEITHNTLTTEPLQIRLYIQRKDILRMYVDTQKKYICYDCGYYYSLHNNLSMHVRHKACYKKTVPPRLCDMLQDKDLKNYRPKVSNKKRKERNRLASIAAAAVALEKSKLDNNGKDQPHFLSNLGQTAVTLAKANTKGDKPPDKQNSKSTSKPIAKPGAKPYIRKKKKKKPLVFPPLNSVYHPIFAFLGFQRKQMVVLKTITTKGIYNQVIEFLHFRRGTKARRSGSVVRRIPATHVSVGGIPNKSKKKRTGVRENRDGDTYNGLVDMRVLVQEVLAGRYPSIQPYIKDSPIHSCQVCKKKKTPTSLPIIYSCAFCWRNCHVDCVYEKRPFLEFDPTTDEFMCNICMGYVLARRARAQKRKVKKMESLLKRNKNNSRNVVSYGSFVEKGFPTADDDDDDDDGNITEQQQQEDDDEEEEQRIVSLEETNIIPEVVDQSMDNVMRQGREMNELLQLATYKQLRLKRAIFLSRTNDLRRSMCEEF